MYSDLLAKQRKRRDKPQLSCNPCRKRKVRCDRKLPCETCVSRGEDGNCVFAPHLFKSDQARTQDRIASNEDVPSVADALHSALDSTGRTRANVHQQTSVDGEGWAAMAEDQPPQWPELLHGLREGTSLKRMLASVPSKPEVDRLVSKYFNSLDLAVWVTHPPTFQEEYDRFWEDHSGVSPNWLSMLFSVLCLATDLLLQPNEPLPLEKCEEQKRVSIFRRCSAQCLLLGDYTRPSTYTAEALLLYFFTELIQLQDANFGLQIVLTSIIRVAMKMGYHRDSSHSPHISIFVGEMRRRVWTILVQFDTLVSLQIGLPRMINERDCDTQLPRNIPAEEMNVQMTTLPPTRPESGNSPASYMRSRTKLVSVLAKIHDHFTTARPMPYETVIALHEMLDAEHAALPPGLKVTASSRVTESAGAVMRSISLDLLYQKSRCVLHRGYMTPQNRLSWETCIDAALAIIRHQTYVYNETKPSGLLHGHLWKLTYMAAYDFLLGSMILGIGLQSEVESSNGRQTDMRKALEDSNIIWTAWYTKVKGYKQILDSVKHMMNRATKTGSRIPPREDSEQNMMAIAFNDQFGTSLAGAYRPN
ncbi:hypothetical protein BJX64DRAFT_297519 [Aspergillus heterothallicus]